jgi:hypothetical protein
MPTKKARLATKRPTKKAAAKRGTGKTVLLAGGNPQIAKATRRCKPTSLPCRGGNARSVGASTA